MTLWTRPRLATDLGEFAFDYADMQLKDLKIGGTVAQGIGDPARALDRAAGRPHPHV